MRIGILGVKNLPATMGADRVVESLIPRLPSNHEYTVYVVRDGCVRPSLPRNVRLVEVPALAGKHLSAASYFALACLHAALIGRYDVVHLHNSDVGAFCWPFWWWRRFKVIGTFHGDPYRRKKWGRVARAFLRLSERCFVRVSDVLTSVTPAKLVEGRDVHYIPNGIEPWVGARGLAPASCIRLGLPVGAYAMFACGRLDSTKGLHHLLDAYALLPNAPTLLVIGDFSHDRVYSESVRRRSEPDARVVLHDGLVPRDSLLELLAAAACFVFPSEHEGMSMMLLEALSTGVPVVCSDIPENLAVVGGRYPGQFRSGDAKSLSSVLNAMLTAEGNRVAAATLRSDVLVRFSWDTAAAAYGELYRQMAAECGRK